jgi:hypothetical protein
MKKFLKFSLAFAFVLTAIGVHASEADFSLKVKKENGKTVSFVLNEVKNVELSIYDTSDKLIHTEKINSEGNINRVYNLAALPEGTYFLQAETEMKIAKYEIKVVGETATLSDLAINEVYKPILVNENGKVSLSILNFDKSPVNVVIYDEANNEVYNKTFNGEQNVNKFFDITTLAHEKYTFVMAYDNKVFTKTVSAK